MAYAPYFNDQRVNETAILGAFTNVETDKIFEFTAREAADLDVFAPEFPHLVFVGNNAETRCARVLKTVVYVVTDEDENGDAVTEKWDIKKFRAYVAAAA